jgi:CPA2 family monovalent cation:H+ antiporter-2
VVPRLIAATIASRNRDVFILSVIVTVLGTAYLTSSAGLSTALGAFVAGIVISESEYSHQVLADVVPFRETFNSLFFVSIGMLLNPAFLSQNFGVVLLFAGAVVCGKALITSGAVAILGMPMRIAAAVGLYLAQVGEFSLVLLTASRSAGVFSESFNQMILSVTLLTMIASPFLAVLADRVGRMATGRTLQEIPSADVSDHTVVIGYGLNGQNVAASLRSHGMPYVILEMNPQTVRKSRAAGEPVYYVAAARQLNADLYIIARTRYVSEIEVLYRIGADTVIAEEFETSLEIIRRILGRFGYRPATIDREVLTVRQRRYEMFRGGPLEKAPIPIQTGLEFDPFEAEVRKKSDGRSLAELRLREATGATVIAVRRGPEVVANPGPGHVLHEGDHVYLIGNEEAIRRAMRLL